MLCLKFKYLLLTQITAQVGSQVLSIICLWQVPKREALEGFLGIQGYWSKLKGIQDIFVNI